MGRQAAVCVSITLLVGSVMVLPSCMTFDPYTGEKKVSSTTKGALLGAGAGAVIGLLTGDDGVERRQHAMIGAGIGALAGGSVGFYMDRQEAKLRHKLAGTGVGVTRNGDNLTLNMPGHVTFKTDSEDLNASFFDVLESVSLVLKEFDKTMIEVAGHTDSTGSDAYNQALSEKRAQTVGAFLVSREIKDVRIVTIGLGEAHPIDDNSTAQGRQANRRVELTLVPLTKG